MKLYARGFTANTSIILNWFSFFIFLLQDDLKAQLSSAGDKLVVIDFFATWCGPCKMISPKLTELSQKFAEKVVIVKVSIISYISDDFLLTYQTYSLAGRCGWVRGYRHGVQRVQHADICVCQERQQGRGVCRGQCAETGRHHYEVRLSNAAIPQCLFCWIDLTPHQQQKPQKHAGRRRDEMRREEKRREKTTRLTFRWYVRFLRFS